MFPTMIAIHPDLHIAVRETYRLAMTRSKTQHEAFDRALALFLERRSLEPGRARRVVAVMLANEPYILDASSFEPGGDAPDEQAVARKVRREAHKIRRSAA